MYDIIKDNIKDLQDGRALFTGTKNALIDYLDLGVHIGLTG